MTDLTTPYRPCAIHYDESDCLEYVTQDVPTVAEQVHHSLAILRDMRTREIVGFRLADWTYLREELRDEA